MSVPTAHVLERPTLRFSTQSRYRDRDAKAAYVVDKYRSILVGSVLDVGCDTKRVGALLGSGVRYTGVDMCAAADVVLDLDAGALPFSDRAFYTVLCTDVLEHLEQTHRVFDELCRVGSEWVVVSLPNPIRHLLESIGTGRGGQLKYYGLPTDRPPDRHRWFFGMDDAVRFLSERGSRMGFEVEQIDMEEGHTLPPGCLPWLNEQGENLLEHPAFKGSTLWCVLRRVR